MAEFKKVCNDFHRMCHYNKDNCRDCPFDSEDNKSIYDCFEYLITKPERAETIIKEWAEKHPLETWENKLKKALPDVDIDAIIPHQCPGHFFKDAPIVNNCKRDYCIGCWNDEIIYDD